MERLLLDACAVINLWAADILEDLATTCGSELMVSATVTREATYIEGEEPDGEREPIDWQRLTGAGWLRVLDFADAAEMTAFLGFIPRLGDGEAASLAIGGARELIVATDDGLALRVAAEQEPAIVTVTTPDIVSWWADAAAADDGRIAAAISRIEARARFTPGPGHPLAGWWRRASVGS